ncbi:major facilitator superfamily domain-containing protein [Cokeromyces recurvatus]|uniref:major facilitator superfamily domain-containing protein n=1 Tax=Cokeromyces recurvatus TaxID=90255 RepID=UPI00221E9880|nr:major facilitator superfamily domain-containing protein [Cokeromyces recurvatus]KAI7898914.1 major facilitator superfamily domain-containing protein [Cokeromyces recurvatus]
MSSFLVAKNDNIPELPSIYDSDISIDKFKDAPHQKTQTPVYGTTWVAWLQVISIMLINCACALMWMTGASSPTSMSAWLQVDFTLLNWLSNVAAIVNTVFSLITLWSYERFSLKKNIMFASITNLIGCWIRCLAIIVPKHNRYIVMIIGQVIASIGGPFIYNIAAKFASLWFAPKHRGLANTLTTLSLGMILSPLMMPKLSNTPEDVPQTLLIVAIISTGVAIPSFFLPSLPRIPCSPSANQGRLQVWIGIKTLFVNTSFWICAFLCAINAGMAFSMSTFIMEAIIPFGYTDHESGYCAASITLAGFLGGLFSGYWAGKTGQHLLLIKVFTPLMAFTYIMFIFEIIPNAFSIILMVCILSGFFSYALFPLHVEFACEISYPVPESISSSLLWAISSLSMLIFCVIIDSFRAGPEANPPNNMKTSMIIVAVIVCVGSLPTVLLKGDLKRLAFDIEGQQDEKK